MLRFIMGAAVGSLAIWLWGEELRQYASTGTRSFRMKAADTLQAVDVRAEEVLDIAKGQIHSTLQAGQAAVRPRVV